jgi:hypothetical protein
MTSVFLNYRRGDSAGHAGRLYDGLLARFGRDSVFMDLDSIGPGIDWVDRIGEAVRASDVMLAVIGRNWLNESKPDGTRRLDDPDDVVRTEVVAALDHGLTVVPVLVQGAQMPAPGDLPEDLAPLTRRNAVELADSRWRSDVEHLLEAISEITTAAHPPGVPSSATPSGGYRIHEAAGTPAATVAPTPPKRRRPSIVRFRQISSWGAPLRVAAPLSGAALAAIVVLTSGVLNGPGHHLSPALTQARPAAPAPSSPGPGVPTSGAPPPTLASGVPSGTTTCQPGSHLSGHLSARHVSCATARQVNYDYLTRAQPGRNIAPGRVGPFLCHSRLVGHAFHVSCRDGRASSSFVGAAH